MKRHPLGLHLLIIMSIIAFCTLFMWQPASAALDLNQANAADLDGLKGVGPSTSTRILEERKKSPFQDWNDFIARVKGISAKKASKLSEQGLTINQQPFAGSASTKKDKPKKEKSNQDKKKGKKSNNDSENSS